MRERPHGALTEAEALKATRLYSVYFGVNHVLARQPLEFTPAHWFGQDRKTIGYLFDNYFHALAYSLKVKQHGKKDSPVSGA